MVIFMYGCSSTPQISSNPRADLIKNSKIGDRVVQGLKDAKTNLDNAVTVGILADDDPALLCVADVLKRLGVGEEEGMSFEPVISDLISAGSVAYIYKKILEDLRTGGLNVSNDCKALIGEIVIDAIRNGGRVAGAGFLGLRVLTPGLP